LFFGPFDEIFTPSFDFPDFTGSVQLGRGATTHAPLLGSQAWQVGQVTWVPPVHVPLEHAAPFVHASGAHEVPSGCFASGGQLLLTPSQLSATSQAPVEGRHTPVFFASAGHALLVPSQTSATSQSPAAGRHGVPEVTATSGGQVGD
jgi:hypothetical protein